MIQASALLALVALGWSQVWAVHAADVVTDTTTPKVTKKKVRAAAPKQLQQVTVTGSRIPRASIEGATPVTVIKAEDIDKHGFRNAFDALSALSQNTGFVQGSDFGSTFTPVGNFLNLKSLGPNHTLVLINGHRMVSYPSAYDGSVDAVNLANIPSQSIDRIEILSSGASAIYGSDAIAGVVNIILKQHYQGTQVDFRTGGTQGGGGANQRLQLTQGFEAGKFDGVVGVELSHQEPLRYGQRNLSDSYLRYSQDPKAALPRIAGISDPFTGAYYAPAPGGCLPLASGFQHSVVETSNPRRKAAGGTGPGVYCGSDKYHNDETFAPQIKEVSGFASLHYHFNDDTEAYGDFLYSDTQSVTNVRHISWSSDSVAGPFWNADTNRPESWTRVLSRQETGGLDPVESHYLERAWSASLGLRGRFGDSDWHYDANYSISEYSSDNTRSSFLPGIDDYFLGPQLATHDVNGSTLPVYRPHTDRLYGPISPATYRALSARNTSKNLSWLESFDFSVNGALADLPGGSLSFAAVTEIGSQTLHEDPDPRINEGYFWNQSEAYRTNGNRSNYAGGVELNAPLLSNLTLDGAARYDSFKAGNHTIGAPTYHLSLEYRPIDSLLLRGDYGTSFRAPDMHYTFEQGSKGYYPSQTDYYHCRLDPQSYSSCTDQYDMNYTLNGNPRLKPETATAFGYGLVWSPSHHFDVSADYYHVVIEDEVTNLSVDTVLENEADCQMHATRGGAPVDPNSTFCQQYVSRVSRNPTNGPNPNQVTNVRINPINAASERTSGLLVSSHIRWGDDRWGRWQLTLDYTDVLSHKYQQYAGGAIQDELSLSYRYENPDWRSKLNASLDWTRGPWSASAFLSRWGRQPRVDGERWYGSYVQLNGSVGYQVNPRASVSFEMQNIANRKPVDYSGGWPYYLQGIYNEYGRQWWVEFSYHFGKMKS